MKKNPAMLQTKYLVGTELFPSLTLQLAKQLYHKKG
jgi:hypothetical protein